MLKRMSINEFMYYLFKRSFGVLMVEFVSTFMFVPNCMLLKILDLWIVFHYLILNDCLFWDLRLKKIINEILVEIMCG